MTLKLNGSSSGHVNLDAKAAAASNTLTLPDTTGGELVALESNSDLNIDSNTLFVDASANKVGIGVTSPGLKLHIQDGALGSAPTPNSNCDVVIEGTTDTGIQFLSSGQTQLRFGDAGSTAAGSIIYQHSGDLLKFNYSNSGATTFNDGSGEVGRFTPDGLTFNGDTAAANALDDYEEGTWSPSFTSGVGSGTFTENKYIKVGRLVTCSCLAGSMSTFTSGHAIQLSLPFTADGTGVATGTVMTHKVDYVSDDVVNVCPYVLVSAASMRIYQSRKDGDWAILYAQYLESESQIYVTLTYYAAS